MAQLLSWLALGLGAAALGHVLFHGVRRAGPLRPAALRAAALAAVLLCVAGLLTLPVRPPWSPGQTLAPGLWLGGLAVLVAAPSAAIGERGRYWAASARLGAAAVAVALLLLAFPRWPLDALVGAALGALVTGTLLAGATPAGETGPEGVGRAAEWAALTVTALAATTWLAAFHRGPDGVREWLPVPAFLAAAASAALAARGIAAPASGTGADDPARAPSPGPPPCSGAPRRALLDLVLVLLPLGAVAWLLAERLGHPPGDGPRFLLVLGTGAAVFALVGWLGQPAGGAASGEGELPAPARGLAAILLVLGGAVLAFREWFGFGLGLFLLGGLAALPLLRLGASSEDGRTPVGTPRIAEGAVAFTASLLLLRLYLERYDLRPTIEPEFFYGLVALVAGAALPTLLAGSLLRPAEGEGPVRLSGALASTGLGVALAAAAPLVVWLAIGARAAAAYLVGVAVGLGIAASGRSIVSPAAALLALLMLASAIQGTHLLEPFELRTRAARVALLAALGALLLLWLVLGEAARRVAERRRAAGAAAGLSSASERSTEPAGRSLP